MKTLRNRKGLYEYILTKSVMLIFILGLVSIFYTLYHNTNINSADTIANSEADRVAKEIDDVISLKGVSNTVTIHLKRELKVGNTVVPYSFEITDTGLVMIRLLQHPYQNVQGFATFGLNMERVGGKDKVFCNWRQIQSGTSFKVTKESDYVYRPPPAEKEGLFYIIKVKIDAADACSDYMLFQAEYEQR